MKNIKLNSGHFADYKKDKKYERMFIDITAFNLGYGELCDIDSHLTLLTNLKNDGWINVGINVSFDRSNTIEEFILEVIKPV